jgi:hypothetical protein
MGQEGREGRWERNSSATKQGGARSAMCLASVSPVVSRAVRHSDVHSYDVA